LADSSFDIDDLHGLISLEGIYDYLKTEELNADNDMFDIAVFDDKKALVNYSAIQYIFPMMQDSALEGKVLTF
jgi:hypothetical protein